MQRSKIITLISLIIIITLSNCSTAPDIVPKESRQAAWQNNKAKLQTMKNKNNWTLVSRIGLVSKQGSSSSQLDWVNTGRNYNIKINNALTFGEIKIINSNNKITLEYEDKIYQAESPDALLFKLTNLNLPVSQLEYWVLGLPSPNLGINKLELNEYAMLKNLKQDKFSIMYDDYSFSNNYFLPEKIIIKAPGLYIKVFVQSWYI